MKKDKPLISVVVPIYKVESYLRECIDSILAQTLSDIEVLLVDDGSPDNCGAICDEYAEKDERVRVFHKENGGVSMARKTGVDNATADWITFVDADDTLPSTALADLYQERDGSDIIIGRHIDGTYDRLLLTPEEYRSQTISGRCLINSSCMRLMARHLFDNVTFPPRQVVNGEDMILNIALSFANKRPVRFVSKKVYNYIRRDSSAVKTFRDSVEYETLLNEFRIAAIPQEQRDKYAKDCLTNRLMRFNDIYRTHRRNDWYGTAYYRDFLATVKYYHYHIPLVQRLRLNITNTTLLRLYVTAECFLTYRFGLLRKRLSL